MAGEAQRGVLRRRFAITAVLAAALAGSLPAPTVATAALPYTEVASGGSAACGLVSDGTVRCWGSYYGIGPTTVKGAANVTAVTMAGNEACVLVSGGSVDCWDPDPYDQLPRTPTPVSGVSNATAISGTCAILAGGTVECWQLMAPPGYSATAPPAVVPGLTNVTAISAGGGFACALVSGGTVSCWGQDSYGKLGDGNRRGGASWTPVPVIGVTNAVAIGAAGNHACAVVAGGTVKCWGDDLFGDLGDGKDYPPYTTVTVAGLAPATAVTGGQSHTCALLAGGGVACWGQQEPSLGDGSTFRSARPVMVSGLTNVTAISAGQGYTCALLSTGGISCWGFRGGTNQSLPTPIGEPDQPLPPLNQAIAPKKADDVISGLPSANTCLSRRAFKIRLRLPRNSSVTSATVSLNGRRVAVRSGKTLTAPISLKGLTRGRYTVRIAVRLITGKTLRTTRRYRTCTRKPKPKAQPR